MAQIDGDNNCDTVRTERTAGSLHRDCCAIRVRRQTGHGYWATYRTPDGKLHAVQSPTTYGFETPKEAREAARREIERSHNNSYAGKIYLLLDIATALITQTTQKDKL